VQLLSAPAKRLATSGGEGLRLVLAARPQVVLCDVGLPEMDGTEVCRRIREKLAPPPVMVALTGWGMLADRQRTADAGFDHHIVKPVAPDVLAGILSSVPARAG
jgi:CheY-like chemotaxis protein